MRTGGEVAGFPAFIVSSEAEFVKACSEKTRFFRRYQHGKSRLSSFFGSAALAVSSASLNMPPRIFSSALILFSLSDSYYRKQRYEEGKEGVNFNEGSRNHCLREILTLFSDKTNTCGSGTTLSNSGEKSA